MLFFLKLQELMTKNQGTIDTTVASDFAGDSSGVTFKHIY